MSFNELRISENQTTIMHNYKSHKLDNQDSLPPPSGSPASTGVGMLLLDVVVSISDEAEALGLLNIQSVAFSMSPPCKNVHAPQL